MTTPQPDEEFEYTAVDHTTEEPVSNELVHNEPVREEPVREEPTRVKGSIAASTWIALIIGFLLLILLIVFILQNQQSVELNIFAWSGAFPAGIAFLLFAIGGALFMALIGGWRMLELRRQIKRLGKK